MAFRGGDWRDYAIDHRDGVAVFSIFRHIFDRPVYVIAKRPAPGSCGDQFLLLSGGRVLKRGDRLDRVLPLLDQGIRVVS